MLVCVGRDTPSDQVWNSSYGRINYGETLSRGRLFNPPVRILDPRATLHSVGNRSEMPEMLHESRSQIVHEGFVRNVHVDSFFSLSLFFNESTLSSEPSWLNIWRRLMTLLWTPFAAETNEIHRPASTISWVRTLALEPRSVHYKRSRCSAATAACPH